ncbi:hypothetical protein GCM10010106_01080 [Thermopolyspora flexuosa]|jgi:precorrin-6Y C5,15-methyltransferase (decarboxylating)|uniref:Precorrin-6Y C5,15-methyltransferase (Decarboxylating) n=1 Tax=Thermopolyspora flexuosa TaxID=103836 RepID=A0A543IXV5_9ACTN|nr:precorrin-6y C5,15-methyltransferase (decarboxylating) subunit CbiE [Thermopolyspora flexuosa]TQM75412.1 precorrin-6Y C5,15-methyltransferase (decarboxylating) [Thermopolyspora flexuosa]GGM59104.1 hypothetical protein GCM10010106_01080 [Thermopolyspora flexuosa]
MITVIGLDGSEPSRPARDRLAEADLVVGTERRLAAVPVPEKARRVAVKDVAEAVTAVEAALAAARVPAPAHALEAGPGLAAAEQAVWTAPGSVRVALGRTQRVRRPAAQTGQGAQRALPRRADGTGPAVVVLAEGDPGFLGVVRALRDRGHTPEVLPAVSVVARAFARVGIGWDDAIVVSAYGEEGFRRAVNVCRAHRKVAVLTAPGAGPAELARALAPSTPRTFVVCENLGGPDERVSWPRMGEATTRTWGDVDVVLVLDHGWRRQVTGPRWVAGPGPGPEQWALPAGAFETGGGPRLGPEARALVLARLGPRLGDLVWDVGAGGGEIAVECARLGAAVVAVERDRAACERLRRNVVAHGVKVMLSCGDAPAALEPLPDPDAVVVGGGGPAVVAACAARRPRVVVAVLSAADRVPPVAAVLREHGYAAEGVALEARPLALAGGAPGDGTADAGERAGETFLVWGRLPERAG